MFEAFDQELKEHGWIEGQNVSFEYRFAEGNADGLAKLAAELVQLRVDVILADSTAATNAARNATHTVPIVMADGLKQIGSLRLHLGGTLAQAPLSVAKKRADPVCVISTISQQH